MIMYTCEHRKLLGTSWLGCLDTTRTRSLIDPQDKQSAKIEQTYLNFLKSYNYIKTSRIPRSPQDSIAT